MISAPLAAVVTALIAVTGADVVALLLRITAVAAAGCLAVALARSASAATRHLIALASLGAILVLPAATLVLPAWRLPVLPARPAESIAPAPTTIRGALEGIPRLLAPRPVRPRFDAASPATPTPPTPPVASIETAASLPAPVIAPARAPERARGALPAPWRLPRLPGLLAALGLAGALILLGRTLSSFILVTVVARRAAALDDPRIAADFAWAARRLGVASARVAVTPRVGSPVVTGAPHVVLLPEAARAWTSERLRLVFLHELAHVARGDGWGLLLTRLAACLCWFHPLVHVLAGAARRDCERACDDCVLVAADVRATDYAEHLLDIARDASATLGGLTLAVARRSSLEARLTSIVRAHTRRGPASRRALTFIMLVALACLVPLASVRVVASPLRARATGSRSLTPITIVTADGQRIEISGATPAVEAITPTPDAPEAPDGGEPDARSADAWYDLGHTAYEAHRFADAGEAYLHAAEGGYRPDVAYYNAACSFALSGSTSRAIGALEQAIDAGFTDSKQLAEDSDLAALHTDGRYQLLVENAGHTQDAGNDEDDDSSEAAGIVAEYDRLCAAHSTDVDEWKSIGIELLHADEAQRAIDAFRRQVALEPTSATGVYNMACAYARDGQTGPACETLQRALLLGYGDRDQLTSDDDLESLQGDARFEKLLSLADDLDLDMPRHGDEDVAGWRRLVPHFEDIAHRRPDVGRAWFNLGYAQLRARDPKDGADAFRHAATLGYRKPASLYNVACCLAQSGDLDGAIQQLEQSGVAGMELGNYLRSDRDLDPLRGDARFGALLDRWDTQDRSDVEIRHPHKPKHKDKDKNRSRES